MGRALLAAAIVTSASACEERRRAEEAPRRTGATVEDVAEEPAQYIGRTVTLAGEVDTVFGPQAFELEGPGILWDEELLVLTPRPVRLGATMVEDDDELIVRGTVRRAVIADLERELGWDISPEIEAEIQTQPVVIADSVRRIGDVAMWTADQPEGAVGFITVYTTPDPAQLAGQRIQIERIPVQGRAGKGLWIGYGPQQVMFVAAGEGAQVPADLQQGDRVDVTGVLREMPPAEQAIKQWGLEAGQQQQLEQQPLYLEATQIQPTAVQPGA